MEGDRQVQLREPGSTGTRVNIWATRQDRGGGEVVEAETQVGNWTIRWRVRQIGLADLDHTWDLVDELGQVHDIESLRDIKRMWWDRDALYTVATGANMSLDPIGDFKALAGAVVGADNVHEIVQPSKLVDRHREFEFPSVVSSWPLRMRRSPRSRAGHFRPLRRFATRRAQKILTRQEPSAGKSSAPYAGPGCSSRC